VGKLIERKFGVGYHISHVHRLLGRMGFSAQKPAPRAREQRPEKVEAFRRRRWPAIEKMAREEGRSIVLIDESGFMLQPLVRQAGPCAG
jgi:hypothetical protein